MISSRPDPTFWSGRSVLVTGHTGFKGGWLCMMLAQLGARVSGYALEPTDGPNLFDSARIAELLERHVTGDVRDRDHLARAIAQAAPEVIFHLAAQPLVRRSYVDPVETFNTNVMGSVNLLEGARHTPSIRCIVNVTTDKIYRNNEWSWSYRENEPLGGHDPYSASKACAELVTAAYRDSFLAERGVAVCTARAGNVIGGGDWSVDRLLPDFFRALDAGATLEVRAPDAVRPWQHVLEPVEGYLLLAQVAAGDAGRYAEPWNFGPADSDAWSVRAILDHLCAALPDARWSVQDTPQPHEAHMLKLDSSKARGELGWRPRWALDRALEMTAAWHAQWRDGADMRTICMSQIVLHASENI